MLPYLLCVFFCQENCQVFHLAIFQFKEQEYFFPVTRSCTTHILQGRTWNKLLVCVYSPADHSNNCRSLACMDSCMEVWRGDSMLKTITMGYIWSQHIPPHRLVFLVSFENRWWVNYWKPRHFWRKDPGESLISGQNCCMLILPM